MKSIRYGCANASRGVGSRQADNTAQRTTEPLSHDCGHATTRDKGGTRVLVALKLTHTHRHTDTHRIDRSFLLYPRCFRLIPRRSHACRGIERLGRLSVNRSTHEQPTAFPPRESTQQQRTLQFSGKIHHRKAKSSAHPPCR